MTRLFGTDGIRGEAGTPPLDPPTVRRIGLALAHVLAPESGAPARVALGRDTRESGPELLAHLAAGLAAGGACARSAGVIATPAVSLLARSEDFDAGIAISASHNPWRDNGLKFFSHAGIKLDDADESEVERLVADPAMPTPAPVDAPPVDEPLLAARHGDWIAALARTRGLSLAGLSIAVDCGHGAASPTAPAILEQLGARVVVLNASPDGRNINAECGSLHLGPLARAVVQGGLDAGVAFDGDADRALFVDAAGQSVDGDHVLLILADALRARGELRGEGVVGTVMSNLGLERALTARGLLLLRERVGDRHVLARMMARGCSLGGEPSGHVILLDAAPTGDGLLTAIHVLAACVAAGRSLGELAQVLQRCPQVLVNIPARQRQELADVEGHARLVESWASRLGAEGRMLVRWSGTEPLVRVMVEGTDQGLVETCASELAAHLEARLGAGAAGERHGGK